MPVQNYTSLRGRKAVAIPSIFWHVRWTTGLPRRFAPRNDVETWEPLLLIFVGGHPASPTFSWERAFRNKQKPGHPFGCPGHGGLLEISLQHALQSNAVASLIVDHEQIHDDLGALAVKVGHQLIKDELLVFLRDVRIDKSKICDTIYLMLDIF